MEDKVTIRRRPGLKLDVFDNRIEITEGLWPFRSKKVIPYRNMANVELAKYTRRLVIETNDGDKYTLSIGGLGKAQRAHKAIVERM